ncbi:hypothetical protein Tco_0209999 [Tanacetum coccineum]
MEPDIKNMTLNEYLEYEAEKKRRSWRNVRSKGSPTRHEGVDFNSSHRDKSECGYESPDENPLNDQSYGFTPQFFSQPSHTPNTPVDKKDFSLDEILDNLFRLGVENLRRMGQEKVQNGCDIDTSKDTNHGSGNLLNFPIFPGTNEFSNIYEYDVDLEKDEAQVEDDDGGETYDIWDIMVEDIELIRQFPMPNVPDEIDEILNVTMVDKEADFNPTKDIEELERLLAKDPQSHFTKIHAHSIITKLEPFTHTQPMSPLYGIFEPYKSSTKPYKMSPGYGVLDFLSSWFLAKCRQRYAVSSLMDKAYRIFASKYTWCGASCKKASLNRIVGCYTGDDEVACDGGCCSMKQTWSMA